MFHNQILKLKSQPTLKGSRSLSKDDVCETVLGRRSGYSKGLDWRPRPKSRKSCASSSLTTCSHSTKVEQANAVLIEQQRLKLEEAKHMIEEQRRMSELQTQQMEEMNKMIEQITWAQRGP